MQTINRVQTAMLCMTRQCWEQGVLAQALLEAGEDELLALAVHDIVLRQSADGRLCNIESTPAVIDSAFNILPVLAVAQRQQNPAYHAAAQKNVDYLLRDAPRSESGLLYHMLGTREVWADSAAYMPAVLAAFGHTPQAMAQMRGILGCLRDEATGLYHHMWDDGAHRLIRRKLWGVGNGWILTGLLRLYGHLPQDAAAEREEVRGLFAALLDALLSVMTPEGAFHDVLDDEGAYLETECAEMVAYSVFRGISEGLIDEAYLPAARLIQQTVHGCVTPQGLVTACASSPDFLRPGTSVEGQAHYLMMETAARALARQPACARASADEKTACL